MSKTKSEAKACAHPQLTCLNQYEFIRKYRCESCEQVMMCACDEAIGRRHLPHQLNEGTELKTQRRVPVTIGFQPRVCPQCRGNPPITAPAASIPGRTSKIKRFYWREIAFEHMDRFADWREAHPNVTDEERSAAYKETDKLALDAIKALHAASPKYDFSEPSQAETLKKYGVEVVALHVEHAADTQKGAVIVKDGEIISPEAFVTHRYEAAGWTVLQLESRPLHALFGVVMWMLIQDVADPLGRMAGFGRPDDLEAGTQSRSIWTTLPEDFGTGRYADRRKRAIAKHFKMLLEEREELLFLFDLWVGPSENLRQYLWAHRPEDVQRARRLIEILPAGVITRLLRYLVGDYWGRHLGWPDLLVYKDSAYEFLEVKSSSDKLSDDQKRWIADNAATLKLPFKLVKLHKLAKGSYPVLAS